MTVPISAVNPVVTGWGMNWISRPRRKRPMAMSRTPAIAPATNSPARPCRTRKAAQGSRLRMRVAGAPHPRSCIRCFMPDLLHAPSDWLARLLLQRGLGLVYFIAFLNAFQQFPALLGERGLLPVPEYLARVPFREAPSLFHFRYSDRLLRAVALAGIVLSLVILVGLPDRWPAPLTIALWLVLW